MASSLLLSFLTAYSNESYVPLEGRRGEEQTFLTFPEWYLVHSPAEYANFVAKNPAHDFPFIGHIKQLWSSYSSVTEEQFNNHYPINLPYHVMICVIATSTTFEYGLRSIYENSIGRISWALSPKKLTAEDKYGALVAQKYVDFIRQEPWYLFDFTDKLKGLWMTVPMNGPGMLRKWERRYALSTEYLIKAVYAKVIEFATRQSYIPAAMTTYAVVDVAPKSIPRELNIQVVKMLPDGSTLLSMPRYYNFRIAATQLALSGSKLVDIAGNHSQILVTVWKRTDGRIENNNVRILFEQPIITMPGYERVGMILSVTKLSDFLFNAPKSNLIVEHVYDY